MDDFATLLPAEGDITLWQDSSGRKLSDRIWIARQTTRDQIDAVLRRGIANKTHSTVIARDLEQFLSPSWAPKRTATGRLVARQPKRIVTRTPSRGGGSAAARRIARTEIARAHGKAVVDAARLNPYVQGVRWNLSARHIGQADNCDGFAHRDNGMGPGVYAPDNFPPFPGHPHCRCYCTNVLTPDHDPINIALRRIFSPDQLAAFSLPIPPPVQRQPVNVGVLGSLVVRLFSIFRTLLGVI